MQKIRFVVTCAIVSLCCPKIGSTDTLIAKLPFDANIPGETYLLSANLVSDSGVAIEISANDVVIDGEGKTLIFGQSGPGIGIVAGYSSKRFTIKNVIVEQGDYKPKEREHIYGIRSVGNKERILIHNNSVTIKSAGEVPGSIGRAIQVTDFSHGGTGHKISSNIVVVNGKSAIRGISVGRRTGSDTTWNGAICDNRVILDGVTRLPSGHSGGISLSTDTESGIVTGNSITITEKSYEIGGIGVAESKGWSIIGNEILIKTGHSRAILLDNADSTLIEHNSIRFETSGPGNGEHSAGIRIRFGSDGNIIRNNEVVTSAAVEAIAFRIGGAESLPNHTTRPRDNLVQSNRFVSRTRAVSIERGGSVLFEGNYIAGVSDSGFPVFIQDRAGTADVYFIDDKFIGANKKSCGKFSPCKVKILGPTRNVIFCRTGLVEADIEASSKSTQDYRIVETCEVEPIVRPTL